MTIREIIHYLEEWAPPALQEDYDNAGLLVGDARAGASGVLVSLDITEEVVQEAIQRQCNLIVAHHPVIFGGLKRLTGQNYVARSVALAIKHDIALYAAHTNLDKVQDGVNHMIGEKLGAADMRILAPERELLRKLVVFVPTAHRDEVMQALFAAGAGQIGDYDECSFHHPGTGSFRAGAGTDPYVGQRGQRHYEDELRLEVILPHYRLTAVLQALEEAHPYEEVAYDLYPLENKHPQVGSGMLGRLPDPVYSLDLLQKIKEIFGGGVRYTPLVHDQVQKIAWCGGSGSFLLPQAKAAGAQLFLTSDFKYHQFFDAENQIIVADIGHYECEQFTKDLVARKLGEKFPNFAVLLSETNTNPVNYL